ncbi:MAG: hypothetical protein J6B75_02120 [Ruminococcus sp.]|nr:hypothetical protein [Ruminococcus sp.]
MRPIDADKLKEEIKEFGSDYEKLLGVIGGCTINSIQYIISQVPTVEAEPVRHGTWKHCPGMNSKCLECGQYFPVDEFDSRPFDINYCPNCGAKMEGGEVGT